MVRFSSTLTAALTLALLAGCATPPPPPPPTPPPPVIVLPPPPPPPRPFPPNSSAPNLVIPITDLNGRRMTPNVDLSPEQALWHFRIGLNVAALNCRGPNEAMLVANYSQFLRTNQRAIAAAERRVIANLGAQARTNGIALRDALSTRLYNYFAQPPVTTRFCEVATSLTALAAVEPSATILPFASTRIVELDQPFVDFYANYARYQADLARWQATQPPPVMTTPMVPSTMTPVMPAATTMPTPVTGSAAPRG
jgi:hypothetical protein